jgi:type I restriction enzyme, S subunit
MSWPLRKIDDVAIFLNARRKPVKAADRAKRQGQFPYYGASGIVDWVDDFIFEGEYLLISEDGENLRSRNTPIAFMAGGRFWVNNHAHILDEREPGILRYLSWALNKTDLSPYITGAAQPKLNKRTLSEIEVAIPPLDERLAINAILGALDDKIELNRRMAATLEEMARALYRSWFVDFDPVKAMAEGLAPAFMDEATAALFPDRFGDDGLPEGWETMPLSSLCVQVKDSIDPRKNTDRIFDHYSLPAFDAGKGPVREPGSAIQSQKLRIPTEAILFSRLNPITPRIWWARTSDQVFASVASTEFLVAVSRIKGDMPFLYSLLVSDEFRGNVIARVTGTSNSHQRVKPASVLDIEVVGATEEIRTAYGAVTAPWFDRIDGLNHENRTLAKLRDSLLPKLMSGELRVGSVDEQVEAVA